MQRGLLKRMPKSELISEMQLIIHSVLVKTKVAFSTKCNTCKLFIVVKNTNGKTPRN